ncbi:DUF3088 family protein [Bradyrhizobium barranii]
MTGDRLFLLKPGFEDPEQPGRFFVCSHCNAIEGAGVVSRAGNTD